MTKEEFERGYCERSGITLEDYRNELNLITLPCECENKMCNGWAAVENTPRSIKYHNDFCIKN